MKHVMRVCMLVCALLIAPFGVESATKNDCRKSTQSACKQKKVAKTAPPQKKKSPVRRIPELRESKTPLQQVSRLTGKQSEMRDAFIECMGNITEEKPIEGVVEHVFEMQARLEDGGIASFFRSLRGSTTHHGHEVCLVRAFGLKGFRDVREIVQETGNLLFPVHSTYVEVDEVGIPSERRVARAWVRDWLSLLGEEMHQSFAADEVGGGKTLLRVTSTVRSFEEQAPLVRRGLSPADCRYEFLCSSHTSASAVDLGLKNVSHAQRTWLERRLIADQRARRIYFIREGSHFHVFVLPPKYMGEE